MAAHVFKILNTFFHFYKELLFLFEPSFCGLWYERYTCLVFSSPAIHYLMLGSVLLLALHRALRHSPLIPVHSSSLLCQCYVSAMPVLFPDDFQLLIMFLTFFPFPKKLFLLFSPKFLVLFSDWRTLPHYGWDLITLVSPHISHILHANSDLLSDSFLLIFDKHFRPFQCISSKFSNQFHYKNIQIKARNSFSAFRSSAIAVRKVIWISVSNFLL